MASSAPGPGDLEAGFLRAATVPLDGSWHGAGTLADADALLVAHPGLATGSLYAAAVLGDDAGVAQLLAADLARATAPGGPHGWDPLTYLCFSRYLRLDPARGDAFVRAARALLDAGASANTGFSAVGHGGAPERESVLYGAAGVARHAGLTRLLLERGADPNDGETVYHAPETVDDGAVHALVESGRLDAEGLTTMLHRKLDWHHREGVAWLLAHGADPNRPNHPWRCASALHHALGRCNSLRIFELLLDHGADPTLPPTYGGPSPALAAWRGRADVLDLFHRRGFAFTLVGDDAFLDACARGDEARARTAVAAEPDLVTRLQATDGALLAEFAGAGNTSGVRLLLDLGFDIASPTDGGGSRRDSPLHVAVWRGRVPVVRLLLDRGAPLEQRNGRGATPLSLAVRALVEGSDWTPHDSTDIVVALLDAGARVDTVERFPTGSPAADDLLRRHGRAN